MRLPAKLSLLTTLFALAGCRRSYAPPETPMPPDTILLSQVMRELSAQPGFTEPLLQQLNADPTRKKQGPALLTPRLIDDLRNRILGKDWSGLDRFPGWTMREINPTVRVAGHYAGKDEKLEEASAVHPGAPLSAAQATQFLDIGPYALDRSETVSLDKPSTLPPFSTDGLITTLGDGVTRGDGPNNLAAEHAESQRLADILNRLAANKLDGSDHFAVWRSYEALDVERRESGITGPVPDKPNLQARTPEEVIRDLQATGHTVTVTDTRYFANFTHLHYSARGSSEPAPDVMAPFWVNSGLVVPNSNGRPLLIPVSHAELEWHIRAPHGGPGINADVAYYFGVDGKSQWRTMDTLDQAWVLKRDAHTYIGAQAVEVTRLTGLLTVAYMHLHAAHATIPFGGYYALGVCQDGVSAIEHALTGQVTLFPNTVDAALFNDPRDAEINALMHAIPKDRDGLPPDPARIFGSLPVAPAANGSEPFAAVTIPGLAADLNATYSAWQRGKLERPHTRLFYIGLAAAIGTLILVLQRRRQRR